MQKLLILLILFSSSELLSQQMDYDQVLDLEIKSSRENSAWAKNQPYVVLISIDGFRYDYAQKYGAKNIQKLASEGLSTERLIPSFPSKTFPNHYTIVTGLYPSTHGLVSNEFYSRYKESWYAMNKPAEVRDGTWYGGTPLWVLAEQQKMLSASLFWVGSEADIQGVKPTYFYKYDGSMPNELRVKRLVEWLQLPEEKRPHFVAGYFSLVDDTGHRFGPDHPSTGQAVLAIDTLIGVLYNEIKNLDLPVHLVVVSDHGMASINRGLVLSELASLGDSEVAYSFPPMIYQQDPKKVDEIYAELSQQSNLEVFKKYEVPKYLHFENTDRVGDIVILTQPPLVILEKQKQVSGGTHGFDPYNVEDMGGIFYASGPKINQGLLSPIENIHIYPFIVDLLGLKLPEEGIDGSLGTFKSLLKE